MATSTVSDKDMTPIDTPMKIKGIVSSSMCLHNDKTKNLLLPNINISMCLGKIMTMIEYGYAMNKTDLGVKAHQSPTFCLSIAGQCFIGKVISHSSKVQIRSIST